MQNSLWPNNLDLDWDRVHELAMAIHKAVEDSVTQQQHLIEGLILMEWLAGVATVNYRVLRNQMMGQMIDGNKTTEEIFAITMSPKATEINIDISDLFGGGKSMDGLMEEISSAVEEAMQEARTSAGKNVMADILKKAGKNGKEEIDQESFLSILNALKGAVDDSPNEEE